ncbi:hypothetical protein FOZ63_033139 [Perkinsus olseni]|uniref:Uncharacterized protein n=1 Tax=Perkinsus olseni TaxID=32597 RepID=A0A7J6T197_PEROL|nr:hypothetical protein FOZ60_007789 [Perkinsus olseni]KAF4738958.1 hypothetical protein FOZ63_033139 [Perkinsus olseni]
MDIVADSESVTLDPNAELYRLGTDDNDWLEYYAVQYSLTDNTWSLQAGDQFAKIQQLSLGYSERDYLTVWPSINAFVSKCDSLLRQMGTLLFEVPDEIRITNPRNNLKDEVLRDIIADQLARQPQKGYAAVRRLILTGARSEPSNGESNNKASGTSNSSKTTTGKDISTATAQSTKGGASSKNNGFRIRYF